MDIKQGEENTQFVKDDNEKTEKYIFQKNTKTKVGFTFILTVLIIITAAILVSLFFFNNPS